MTSAFSCLRASAANSRNAAPSVGTQLWVMHTSGQAGPGGASLQRPAPCAPCENAGPRPPAASGETESAAPNGDRAEAWRGGDPRGRSAGAGEGPGRKEEAANGSGSGSSQSTCCRCSPALGVPWGCPGGTRKQMSPVEPTGPGSQDREAKRLEVAQEASTTQAYCLPHPHPSPL